jgi:hypothetical protein
VDLVDTMDGVDLVEQAHIPAGVHAANAAVLGLRTTVMQGGWDDDPSDVL